MKPSIRKIFEVYGHAERHLAKSKAAIDKNKLNNALASIYSPGPSFQYVTDFSVVDLVYVSEQSTDILGIAPDELTAQRFLEAIHPDDLEHFKHCEEVAAFFLFSFIKKEDIPRYKISYQFRMKDKHDNYKLILHQAVTLSVDEQGNISTVMANHSDISHITTTNNYKMSFIDIYGEASYYNISSIEDIEQGKLPASILSKREIEILQLLAEGYQSKEIATQLFISYDTVRTHRNNILKKTKMNTITQVVAHFIKVGLI